MTGQVRYRTICPPQDVARAYVSPLAVLACLFGANVLATTLDAEQLVAVPSGQEVVLKEVLIDDSPGETWVRFRFVAPQIARADGEVGFEMAAGDMDHLCKYLALPYLADNALSPVRVVVSMSDREIPFGASDPETTQFFQTYRSEGSDCIWEEY